MRFRDYDEEAQTKKRRDLREARAAKMKLKRGVEAPQLKAKVKPRRGR